MKSNKSNWKLIILMIALMPIMTGAVVYLKSSGVLSYMYSAEAFKSYINGFGQKAYVIFFMLQLLGTILAPIPNNITAAAGAAVLGGWQAFFISTFATLIGSAAAFILAKKLGRPIVNKLVGHKISDKYEKLISKKGTTLLILMFLLPFFPDDALCFLAGMSKISFRRFFIITVLTRPWGILGSTLIGSGSISLNWLGWALIIIISVLIVIYQDKIEEKLVNGLKYMNGIKSECE
ncbi:TVP38/TMEM64 family protein [Clostridium sp. YIM B02515]|uniref:TVP38/TMEM64 family membrane protein n=1 Tax=Clostridium rhizosphaerae TaxID=2803861 RepID=A0ABS1TJR9_9CLOT|nr:VTT domain-containing protein [Clostridium rhizosphaerae]MBL4938584.1 TVP38/TMEM64 family protein [Clostridium rhizosphaerae]